ncbi:MAG: phosphoribosylamine--glycine ligase [Mariniphaga sp.]
MNVLLLGAGGREHALAWKLAQSATLNKLFIAPGNAGTSEAGENVPIPADNFEKLGAFALENKVSMVIVGPEDPLVKGVTDYFQENDQLKNIAVIGPSKKAAMLEGSKEFAKEFMMRHNIPTASYFTVTPDNLQAGLSHLDQAKPPYVLKADGLAAGKGVLIIHDLATAKAELQEMIEGKFGQASSKVVIEEHLKGIELSVFVITDGKGYIILPEAKDYKRIGEGDTGLNTGGMGAVSPVPFADDAFLKKVEDQIVRPTVEGLAKDNLPYKGFIFIGLMNDNGNPKVVEYNVRMGDPETEVVLPRVKNDFLEIMQAVAEEKLAEVTLDIDERTAVTVMMVSGGYPEAYEKGKKITGLDQVKNSIVFHAGTKHDNGSILTSGGRVLSITSYGANMQDALTQSYMSAGIVNFDKAYFRKDIGFDL